MAGALFKRMFSGARTSTAGVQGSSSTPGTTIRVLAFGDSLTEGFTAYGSSFYPYADKLQELLSARSGGHSWEVRHSGVSGERVLGTMQPRLERYLEAAQAEGIIFDWVLLLAGVNDVGGYEDGDKIFEGLCNMYKTCHQHAARVMAMTLLENSGTLHQSPLDQQRQKVNQLIRQQCSGACTDVVLCDTEKLLPFVALSLSQRAKLYDDGLHLTPKGYDRMAEILHQALIKAQQVSST